MLHVPDALFLDDPPFEDDLPTLPYDLTEYARIHTGDDDVEPDDDDIELAGPLLDVRRGDVPRIAYGVSEQLERGLNPREAFILWLIDGRSDVDTVLDGAGIPQAEALDVLCGLCARGIVTLERGSM